MNKKCGVYIRVSTNNIEQQTSLINQKHLFLQKCKLEQWDIHDFYIDIESGTSTKRPELLRLLKDTQDKKINLIVAKELSRLARHIEFSHQIKRIAETNNVDIVTLDGAINTLKQDNYMFGLYAWLYENEAQIISRRSKDARASKAKRGLFTGSLPPYGYDCINGVLHIRNDDSPQIIQRIFAEYISGKGVDSIARGLYNDGIPTHATLYKKKNAGDKWYGNTIKDILQNEAFIGNLVQQKETTISVVNKKRRHKDESEFARTNNTHKGIISTEDFYLVQELLKARKHQKYQQSTHLFSGIAFCNTCGKGMHFKANRKGYVCGNFNKHGIKACSDHVVRELNLEQAIINDISTFINALKTTSFLDDVSLTVNEHISKKKRSLELYEQELNLLNSRKTKSLNLLVDGVITKDDYNLLIDSNTDDILNLQQKIDKCNQELKKLSDDSLLSELTSLKKEVISFKNLTKDILNRFVKRIEIKEDGTPIIFYRFPQP